MELIGPLIKSVQELSKQNNEISRKISNLEVALEVSN